MGASFGAYFHCCLNRCDLGVVRIDGSVGAPERASRVKAFNSTPCEPGNPQVMLLTTGVGALGLTLTGADRVIM
jgi:SNF2 family DNA or RNA helicase